MPTIAPGAIIGIIGGGQLGRMLAIAAAEMGYHTHIFCPETDAPAYDVAGYKTIADYGDQQALAAFARSVAVITYEFENIPHAPIETIAATTSVYPSPDILATSQHRIREKLAINQLGIATAPFRPVTSLHDLQSAAATLGLPAVLKTCRMGYDGKGQAMLKNDRELAASWQEFASLCEKQGSEAPLILEGFVNFTMEISVIIARDAKGNIACYPPVQNIHKHHILAETIAPAPISAVLSAKAEATAHTIAEGLNLVGLMAVEMFVTAQGDIIVNELAPRPHNSGHWTIDACVTSQFEQTIRAICGLPLGSTARLCDARMLNLIGDDVNNWQNYLAQPCAKLHLYGKKQARSGRKMGHVTFLNLP